MPASIRIESGISAGTSFWIDRSVLRIGSDPQCEICLPSAELSPHAVTLEFRSGTYRLYNRGTAPIVVGDTTISPGGHEIWKEDVAVQLPGNLRLVLDIDGDSQPSPRPESRRIGSELVEQEPISSTDVSFSSALAPETKKTSSTLVQLAVILLCVGGMALFLTMGRGDESTSPQRPTFEGIVEKLLAADSSARPLLQRLQYAQAALVRGHNEQARQRFLDLRDRLVRQREGKPQDDQQSSELVLEYVEYRLSQLR